ncbi:2OG-Fe(II) oxygenase superfamily protein [uncultured virus]|nr:2OG-Fe(II) oxygenase superfamily protein [uncultured virus]
MEPTMITPKVLIHTGTSTLWIAENFSPDIFSDLQGIPIEKEPPIIVRGKECKQRRNVGFFSDESIGYKYSKQMMKSRPLIKAPILQKMLPIVNQCLGTNFNGILVNQYLNGEHYLSSHSDDERGLDKTRNMVAGISYGTVRKFRIRNKQTGAIVLDYNHTPGTLLVMEGNFQKEFTHEIPIQKKVKDQRISITFRHHTE